MKMKNLRELTKKFKIFGLSRTSWLVALIISGGTYPYLVFKSVFVLLIILIFFYIIEFFDDDFIDVFINNLKSKMKKDYYA